MPTYEYECLSCGKELEFFQKMSDDPLKKCPSCGKLKLKRKLGTGAGIIFKGSGFYCTDFKDKKGAPPPQKKESASSESSSSSSDTKSSKASAGDSSSKPSGKESPSSKP